MDYSEFLDLKAVNRLHNRQLAKDVRAKFSWNDLMTTPIRTRKDGSEYGGNPRQILATTSHKFEMKNGKKIRTVGVYLAPADEATRVYPEFKFTMCSNSGNCKNACLTTTGQMVTNFAMMTRVEKTLAWIGYPEKYLNQYLKELADESRRANKAGEELHARGNGTSDQMWERYILMDLFKACHVGFGTFYDYTKLGKRRVKNGLPEAYHLTFSIDEKSNTLQNAMAYHKAGYSVAVVLHKSEKQKILHLPNVIDGDLSDHRPIDPPGSIVVLYSKGKARSLKSGGFIKDSSFVESMAATCMA